jgi:hypothetical protein
MYPKILIAAKLLLGGIAGLFGLTGAIMKMVETILDADRQERLRAWFGRHWRTIDESRWIRLPDMTIARLSEFQTTIHTRLDRAFFWISTNTMPGPASKGFGIALFFVFLLTFFAPMYSHPWYVILYFLICFWFPLGFLLKHRFPAFRLEWAFPAMFALYVLVWANWTTELPLVLGIVVITAVAPFLWAATCFGLWLRTRRPESHDDVTAERITLISFGICAGLVQTYWAMGFGHIISPGAHVPQQMQMLTANVLCDATTLILTFRLLSWTAKGRSLLRLPFALVFGLAAAALLACMSLYLGLVGTNNQLSWDLVFQTFTGRVVGASAFGPYFWVMHTTSIPIIVILLFIGFCWTAKVTLAIARAFFWKSREIKSPLSLTIALCALCAAVLSLIIFVITNVQEFAKLFH